MVHEIVNLHRSDYLKTQPSQLPSVCRGRDPVRRHLDSSYRRSYGMYVTLLSTIHRVVNGIVTRGGLETWFLLFILTGESGSVDLG